jgi:predicted nucleotide-binding protein
MFCSMSNPLSEQLRAEAEQLAVAAAKERQDQIAMPLQRLADAARDVGASWSESSIGYHARVYYKDFMPPPPGARFSGEWGFFPASIGGTTGEWREYRQEDVRTLIFERAGNPDLAIAQSEASDSRQAFENSQPECLSILSTYLKFTDDVYIQELKTKIEEIAPITGATAARGQMPSTVMTRDPAAGQSISLAPHQEILARLVALQSSFRVCQRLSTLAGQAAAHIDRMATLKPSLILQTGGRVFIGHGRSLVWRELKDFVSDRLRLPWDEFNRVAVAGTTTIARLQQMLDEAAFAFLILTAEDEQADGKVTARQNVIHESGLFQGRLGFERAIILLEEGCEEFSNIHGLSQLRFPPGKVDVLFEKVREVLEREGLVE